MKNKLFYLVLSIIILMVSCKKEEENTEVEIKDEKENLLCRKWEQTLLIVNGDTSSSEGWIFAVEFLKDRTFIMHTSKLNDSGDVVSYIADSLDWSWSGENFNSVEVNTKDDADMWINSNILELSNTKFIIEQDRENVGILRFYYKPF